LGEHGGATISRWTNTRALSLAAHEGKKNTKGHAELYTDLHLASTSLGIDLTALVAERPRDINVQQLLLKFLNCMKQKLAVAAFATVQQIKNMEHATMKKLQSSTQTSTNGSSSQTSLILH